MAFSSEEPRRNSLKKLTVSFSRCIARCMSGRSLVAAGPVVPAYPITSFSIGNALGATTKKVVESLHEGRSGLAKCQLPIGFATFCGAFTENLDDLAFTPEEAAFDSRLARIASAVLAEIAGAVSRVIRRWGGQRVAMVLGTSTGGIRETERAWEALVNTGEIPSTFDYERQHCFDGLLKLLQKKTGISGPCYVVSTACSSSGKVFGVAQRLLGADFVDAVLVGGVDTLCHTTLRGFHSLQLLSERACRPFAVDRDGLSLGEGAAWLIIERDGEGLASLLGVGESCDAHHMSQPHPQGKGAYLAMSQALRQAGITPEEVDYINAHGTATPSNDLAEGQAIAALFGTRTPVVSTKGYTGHLLGAAGATEVVFSIISIMQGWIPISLGAENVDPAIFLLINSQEKREQQCQLVLSNSFAFGGNNVSVLLGAPR